MRRSAISIAALCVSLAAGQGLAQRPATAIPDPIPQRPGVGVEGATTATELRRAAGGEAERANTNIPSRLGAPSDRAAARDQIQAIERDYERGPSGAWRRRGEIVVAAVDNGGDAAARALGLTLKQRAALPASGLTLTTWTAPADRPLERLLEQLRAARPADSIDLNYVYEYREAAQSRGRIETAPPPPGDGRAKVAAIIEVGLPANGPWLQGVAVKASRFAPGQSRASEHASAVAALLVGAAGARGATLLAADVAEGGALEGAAAASIALAADWAAREGAGVINISMTGPRNAVLEAVIDRLAAKDVVIVAAAGNDGPRAAPPWPAAHRAVVAVTAVDDRQRIWRRATQGPHVDFAALGVDVPAGGKLWTGTSMAAPVVAGMLLRTGGGPESLAQSVIDLGALGRDPVYGEGLVIPW